jgi:hypothetical protein
MKIYYVNFNGVMDCFLPFFEKTTNLLQADKVLVWNDLVQPCKKIVELAREYGKESIMIEHGMKAVTDYQLDFRDINNGMGGRPFIADKICVWGNRSKEIMTEVGISEDRVFVVGSPTLWDYEYRYLCGGEERILRTFAGNKVKDKVDGKLWEFSGHRMGMPTVKERKYILFFPFHDYMPIGIEANRRIWEQLKNRNDVVVKLPTVWLTQKDDDKNPFKELLALPQEELNKRCVISDIRSILSSELNKRLLEKAKIAVIAQPGTTNGMAWAMDIPVIVPDIDWGWRVNGKRYDDYQIGDYVCDADKINEEIDKVWNHDTKTEERKKCAIELMGVEAGNPRDNILRVIRGIQRTK